MIDCFYHMRRWASGSLFNCRLRHIILCLPSSKPNGKLLLEVRPNPSPNAHVKLLPCESFQRLLNHTYPTSVALPSPPCVIKPTFLSEYLYPSAHFTTEYTSQVVPWVSFVSPSLWWCSKAFLAEVMIVVRDLYCFSYGFVSPAVLITSLTCILGLKPEDGR